MSPDNLADARKELDKEFAQVREALAPVDQAFQSLMKAGPEDDLVQLLDTLGEAVQEARTGGLIGSGAGGHRKALARYLELKVQ